MKILLDENLDWRLKRDLPGLDVESVPLIGWAGLKNGELLTRAENDYDVLLTMDKGIPHQQYLTRYKIAVVGLRARPIGSPTRARSCPRLSRSCQHSSTALTLSWLE